MKPILVLGPEEPGAAALERGQLDLFRVPATAEVVTGAGVYDSVIVINDGGVDTIRRLLLALAMRRHCRELDVGVLTYLDGHALDDSLAPLCRAAAPLRIELGPQGLNLEYQAD